ncbi:MAG: CHAT domain-containing protein [Symploca sp. SIO2E6]|nr:CHAT domain-containing protein [Symploca sp. SIO2E6]
MTRKILILAANPKTTSRLRLDEEVREIDEGLSRAKHRDQFELVQKWAVRPRDIQEAMLDTNPQIVHFAGHGAGEEGLIFEDEMGQTKFVTKEALAGLFELFADQVECVVLNGCYSQVQAESIAQHIRYVIAMQQEISDRAAITFAVGFYAALGAGRRFEFAHKLGRNAIQMYQIPEHLTPILLSPKKPPFIDIGTSPSKQTSLIPQHEYELLVKDILQARLIKNIPGEDLEIKQGTHYTGKSGCEHEIGVSALMKIAGVKFLILIECKNHSELVKTAEVLEFASRLDDIGAQKGIIVTTRGFDSGALQVAKSKGIALVIACDLDWEICMESPSREFQLRRDFIQKCLSFLSESNKLNEASLSALYDQSAESNKLNKASLSAHQGFIQKCLSFLSRSNKLNTASLSALYDQLYDQSAESMRGFARKFATLPETLDSLRSWRFRGSNGEDSLPHGYVFINNSITDRDVELEKFLYGNEFLALRRDGLFSYISIDLARKQGEGK